MTLAFLKFFYEGGKEVTETSTQEGESESTDSDYRHEDTCFLVEIPQRGLFMSWKRDSGSCIVVSQER